MMALQLTAVIILAIFQPTRAFTNYDSYLLHPVAGDTVYAGQPYPVTWFVDPTIDNLNLYILGGGSNNEIATAIPNTGSYTWNVESYWPSSTQYYMVLNRVDWNTNDIVSPFTMVG